MENKIGKTPIQLASAVKDEALRSTILGLLNKLHTSTHVDKKLDAKRDREARKVQSRDEVNRLRRDLIAKIEERGINIAEAF